MYQSKTSSDIYKIKNFVNLFPYKKIILPCAEYSFPKKLHSITAKV